MRKRRWIWFLLWILTIVWISFYGGTLPYAAFFAVTLIPVISGIYLILVYFFFKIYQEIGTRNVVSDEPVPYYFVLQNDDWFAFAGVSVRMHEGFSYVEEMPDVSEYELIPEQHYKYETRLVCKYRGEYEVGVKEIIVTDFFRLFQLRYPLRESFRAIVNPKVVELETLGSLEDVTTPVVKESYLALTEPDAVVREYVPGDALKQVHWKATARSGELKTRLRTGDEKQGIAVFFDTERISEEPAEYLPVENKVLELALALGLFWAKQKVTADFFYHTERDCEYLLAGLEGFEDFYQKLSGVRFSDTSKPAYCLKNLAANYRFCNSRIAFLILESFTPEVQEAVMDLRGRSLGLIVYVIGENSKQEKIGLDKGINIRYLSPEANLMEEVL